MLIASMYFCSIYSNDNMKEEKLLVSASLTEFEKKLIVRHYLFPMNENGLVWRKFFVDLD